MDWRVKALYKDYWYGHTIKQSWWQLFWGRLTGRYHISVSHPEVEENMPGYKRGYILTSDTQIELNYKYLTGYPRKQFRKYYL